MTRHWATRYDQDDGEPYGELCDCRLGADHDGAGNLNGLDLQDGAHGRHVDAGGDPSADRRRSE